MPIQILSPQLINQISAGEIIEHPSSVVKELIENSLDAGASKIDIDIEDAGSKLIKIRDNGCGISKSEIMIALSRHATSKISSIDDLENIISFGFRGEALTSISSISRLILTSRTSNQNEAWQIYAEGHGAKVSLRPAAHPIGTSVEVLDIFYNTPARRKFMRAKKTEFAHIDEIIRRFALSRFDISISLKHQGKIVRQYHGIDHSSKNEHRLRMICGSTFIEYALPVDWKVNDLTLKGWITVHPIKDYHKKSSDIQYCYVNGRIVRNKIINHAIRQAYQMQFGDSYLSEYVLYLNINPSQLDVNVHPTKHEVRFHQSRLVHDFIWQGVMKTFKKKFFEKQINLEEKINFVKYDVLKFNNRNITEYHEELKQIKNNSCIFESPSHQQQIKIPKKINKESKSLISTNIENLRVLSVLRKRYALLECEGDLQLLSLLVASRFLKKIQLDPGENGLKLLPLLIPIRLKIIEQRKLDIIDTQKEIFNFMGISLKREGHYVTLHAVPLPLRKQNLDILITELLNYLSCQQEISINLLIQWLTECNYIEEDYWNDSQALNLLEELKKFCPYLFQLLPSNLIQKINIENIIDLFQHE